MSIQEYVTKKKQLYKYFLDFVECEGNYEEDFENLLECLDDENIRKDRNELKEFLKMLVCIVDNHKRGPNFILKVEKLLTNLQQDIKRSYSNSEIFEIFGNCKRILYFLAESGIFKFDKYYSELILNDDFMREDYGFYFFIFIKPYVEKQMCNFIHGEVMKVQDYETASFRRNLSRGENENVLCEMIRNDSIGDFIKYVSSEEVFLTGKVKHSLFETHKLLQQRQASLIEYAAFFGSVEIFRYLVKNDCRLRGSLWLYAIHGRNSEIIQILEEKKVEPTDRTYRECVYEAIRCHHNEIKDYLQENKISRDTRFDDKYNKVILKSRNYCFFPEKIIDRLIFFSLCNYNYIGLVRLLLKETAINQDINSPIILNKNNRL